MFLTKECDYAIRVVRALADMEKKTVKTISSIEHIPIHFAYKILKKLEHAGIVSPLRGSNGGYQLARKLEDISMIDIINAVGESLLINECLQPGHVCLHNSNGCSCSVHYELKRVQDIVVSALNERTMEFVN